MITTSCIFFNCIHLLLCWCNIINFCIILNFITKIACKLINLWICSIWTIKPICKLVNHIINNNWYHGTHAIWVVHRQFIFLKPTAISITTQRTNSTAVTTPFVFQYKRVVLCCCNKTLLISMLDQSPCQSLSVVINLPLVNLYAIRCSQVPRLLSTRSYITLQIFRYIVYRSVFGHSFSYNLVNVLQCLFIVRPNP